MPVQPDQLKHVMSHLPGGVCIVTSREPEGGPHGLTAISVCSVSLEPPLVLACIERSTNTHAAIDRSRVFALNLLGESSLELADRFSMSGPKFDGVELTTLETGAPILADAVASCDCSVLLGVPAGDHTIFVGKVEAVSASEPPVDGPLVRYLGRYETLGSTAREHSERASGESA